jgi:hypothetical protein
MHSIMWQYMPADTQTRVRSLIEAASRHATASAPLAWLRLEPPDARSRPELRLTTWPGGEDQRLAYAHPHGTTVDWVTPTST